MKTSTGTIYTALSGARYTSREDCAADNLCFRLKAEVAKMGRPSVIDGTIAAMLAAMICKSPDAIEAIVGDFRRESAEPSPRPEPEARRNVQ